MQRERDARTGPPAAVPAGIRAIRESVRIKKRKRRLGKRVRDNGERELIELGKGERNLDQTIGLFRPFAVEYQDRPGKELRVFRKVL